METTILAALEQITGTGNFSVSGNQAFFPPRLEVDGFGEVPFPLHPLITQELIKRAEVAPYGKGEETVVDEAVRKCWQIDGRDLRFHGRKWENWISKLAKNCAQELGVQGEVQASLYKLLIYEEGGRFLPHKDTEKLDAMFGSLIVALPSQHEGGALVVRHAGEEYQVDFSAENPESDLRYAAFFADCEHEVLPVQSGYRVCLVYNLVLKGGNKGLLNQSVSQHAERLVPLIKKAHLEGLHAVLLDHQYTEANFSLEGLKNHDSVRARTLISAAQKAGYDAYLALLVHHQSGTLNEDYYEDEDYSNPDSGTMGEVYEESHYLMNWIDGRGRSAGLENWYIDQGCIISNRDLEAEEPIEKEGEGYTGNAGCSMEYWYQHAVVVLWKQEERAKVLTRYDFPGACNLLGKKSAKMGLKPYEELAEAVVTALPDKLGSLGRHQESLSSMMIGLIHHGCFSHIGRVLDHLGVDVFELDSEDLWTAMLETLSASQWIPVMRSINEASKNRCRQGVFTLLDAIRKNTKDAELTTTYVEELLHKYSRASSHKTSGGFYQKNEEVDYYENPHAEIIALLRVSHLIQKQEVRERLQAFIDVEWSLSHLRLSVVPSLLSKSLLGLEVESASLIPEYLTRAIKSLEEEVSQDLSPYPDWVRPCPDVQASSGSYFERGIDVVQAKELVSFMQDPNREEHDFRYRQSIRDGISNKITRLRLDVQYETIKKGTPHILRCRKTDASYQRALRTRRKDENALSQLKKLQP